MKVVNASATVVTRSCERGNIDIIERAGRTCYKSEDKICEGSADKFVSGLMSRQHFAMLEHGDYVFQVSENFFGRLDGHITRGQYDDPAFGKHVRSTCRNGRFIVSANIRTWLEIINADFAGVDHQITAMIAGQMDPVFIGDHPKASPVLYEQNLNIRRIGYDELVGDVERATHIQMTVHFTVDRGITHELVRHRPFSFAQESTRYCNYTAGKFGKEVVFVKPCYFKTETSAGYIEWWLQCGLAERSYFKLMKDCNCSAQEARAVLPTSVKADLWMTGRLADWKHFFDLRALEKTGPVHPQMAEVTRHLYLRAKSLYPEVFTEELGGRVK